jgi:glycosyltransferase involved in cell wall biosynthesis
MDAELAEALELVVAHTGAAWWRDKVAADPAGFGPPVRELARRFAGVAAPAAAPPGPAAPPAARPGSLVVRADLAPYTGYGQHAAWIGRSVEPLGLPVDYLPMGRDATYLTPDPFAEARVVGRPRDDSWVLQLAPPANAPPPEAAGRLVIYTMWETTRIAGASVRELNKANLVIVPCGYNREGFEASGVAAPVRVVPMGFDPWAYFPLPWPEGRPFTFGMAARMAHGGVRKGLNEGLLAFTRAFDRGQDVRLAVKVWEDCRPRLEVPDDPRIEIVTTPLTPPMMADWYGGLDCLFVPSKGEGLGFHTLQAMACGRPAIATNYSGTREFWEPGLGWELPYREEPAGEFYAGQGQWAVPTEDGMVDALRAAYAAPGECRRKGALSAAAVRGFTWDRMARGVVAVMAEAGMPEARALAPEPPLPGLARQAAGLLATGVRALALALAGGPVWADPATAEARRAACRRCEFLRPSDRRCGGHSGCGCFQDLKAELEAAACPRGRWPG